MHEENRFLRGILDAITESVVVIEASGQIVYTNRGWDEFGDANGSPATDWQRFNYLDICRAAADKGDETGGRALEGIGDVIEHGAVFSMEYPCHGPEQPRWYLMRATPLPYPHGQYMVITHTDITQRHLAEDKALQRSRIDGLTGIANRRFLDDCLETEWKRCRRLGLSLTLALADIDRFKQLNDEQGHLAGDRALQQIAVCLEAFARRPGDLCARFGGEEFALLWSGTEPATAGHMAEEARRAAQELAIEHPLGGPLTLSIGVHGLVPETDFDPEAIVGPADRCLYRAKREGRNRVVVAH